MGCETAGCGGVCIGVCRVQCVCVCDVCVVRGCVACMLCVCSMQCVACGCVWCVDVCGVWVCGMYGVCMWCVFLWLREGSGQEHSTGGAERQEGDSAVEPRRRDVSRDGTVGV